MTSVSLPLTPAEQLAAVGTYIKVLTDMEKTLRAEVVQQMGDSRVEKVGAYLPDGTRMASVSRSAGNKKAKVVDERAALRWAMNKYPGEIVSAIRTSFLKVLTEHAAKIGQVGDGGVDPFDGEVLDFIEVVQGSPYVTITTTTEGRNRMAQLASGFAAMLESAQ